MLDADHQHELVFVISQEVRCAGDSWKIAAETLSRPSAVWRPTLTIDGNQWCALYGANLQEGVAGFGRSPKEAMLDFDRAWGKALGD